MMKVAMCMLLVAGAVPSSTPITPGRWILSNQLKEALINGQRDNASFPSATPRAVCLGASDAAKGPGLAFADRGSCKILKSTMADGAFDFETECKATDWDDTMLTKSSGRFSADGYSGTSTSIQRRNDMRIEMRSQVEAKRIGDC